MILLEEGSPSTWSWERDTIQNNGIQGGGGERKKEEEGKVETDRFRW
jgi:hypothetical protein